MTLDDLTAIFKSQIDANEPLLHYMIESDLEMGPGMIRKSATIYNIEVSQLETLVEKLDGLMHYTDDPYPGFTQYNHPSFDNDKTAPFSYDENAPTLSNILPIPDTADLKEVLNSALTQK